MDFANSTLRAEGHPVSVFHGFSSLSTAADGDDIDANAASLLKALGKVTDRRKSRGKIYDLVFILAISLVAVLAGASNFREVGDQVADFSQSLLCKLGAKWCFFRLGFRFPSERTIRRVLENIDAAEFDLIVGSWLRERASRGSDGMLALAIDGKVLRGSWNGENNQFTLFSAMIHDVGVTVAQVQVPPGTNEITQVEALLAGVPADAGERVVVTMDAAHTQRDTAEHIAGERGFDYVMTIKGNQPKLFDSVFRKCLPLIKDDPHHFVKERGHGRINRWSTWITDADGIDFPHARQVGCIRREVLTLAGVRISKEYAWPITSSVTDDTTASDLHVHVRNHWGIENKSHYIRDTAWNEDAHQAYIGSGPQGMATLRNLAIGLLRLNGVTEIKRTIQWIGWDRTRALPLLVT
jgi:predicted transposase YbfD/YdcC